MKMMHDTNPKKDLIEKVGDLSGIDIFGPKALVAIYLRPLMTKGGIALPESTRNEDIYQGKVGLVLKKGPSAFTDHDYFPMNVEVGDWVWFRASNGVAMKFNSVDCRLLEDIHVFGKIDRPDGIW